MAYTVEFNEHAKRQFRKLPRDVQVRLVPMLAALTNIPQPPGCVKMAGSTDAYRIRVGDYRVIYTIQDAIALVTVTVVGHRRSVYG